MQTTMSYESRSTKMLLLLFSVNTGLLVASNAGGAKLFSFGPLTASATVLSYSCGCLSLDLINEFYGRRTANLAVAFGFLAILLSVLFFNIAMVLPPAPGWEGQSAYTSVFGMTGRLLAGGWISYLVGSFLDTYVFQAIRRVTSGRFLWLRTGFSTMGSQFIDTCIFMSVAFVGVVPLWSAILGQFLIKLIMIGLTTPLIYLFAAAIRRSIEGRESGSPKESVPVVQ